MKSTTRILIAFLLNLAFSIFELVGGLLTGSAAISSDALHAFGDSLSTGVAYFLERKSQKKDNLRYSILGAIITTAILMAGALIILDSSVERLFDPTPVNYDGMMIFAIVGVIFSAVATIITRDNHLGHHHAWHHDHQNASQHSGKQHHTNFNQKTVSLHMLQDTFGWLIVLIGSIIMRFTDISILDPILSIVVALFILISAIKNLNDILKSLTHVI